MTPEAIVPARHLATPPAHPRPGDRWTEDGQDWYAMPCGGCLAGTCQTDGCVCGALGYLLLTAPLAAGGDE